MQFIILFGPPAVGKMTVGYALAAKTGLKLFHNHMTIELVLNFFPFGHEKFSTLVGAFRHQIFEQVATSDLPGLIFTYVWALDEERDKEQIDAYCTIFADQGASIHFAELEADHTERIIRNKTEFRLEQKPSKRDIIRSEQNLLHSDAYKLNTKDDFFYPEQHIKINNTHLSPEETADIIIQRFGIPCLMH